MQNNLDRVPPQNVEAEQCVLGAMLIEKEAISKVTELLQARDFYKEAHKQIYRRILELYEKNEAVDIVTLTEVLKRHNQLEEVGGLAYISFLANAVPTAANVSYHAKIIEEKALLRQLISVSTNIAAMGYEGSEEVENIVDRAEILILEISSRNLGRDFTPIKEILFSAFKT